MNISDGSVKDFAAEVPAEPPAPEELVKPSAEDVPAKAQAKDSADKVPPPEAPAPEEAAKDPAEKKTAKYKHADITNIADNKIRGMLDRAGELNDKVHCLILHCKKLFFLFPFYFHAVSLYDRAQENQRICILDLWHNDIITIS